ncbi:MAG: IS5 family transposase [Clostridiales bacterium]|nr:IS5 family transposase [Clostridiales bacterium]
MYRRHDFEQTRLAIPFGVALNPESKWIKLSELMPWKEIEAEYAQQFKGTDGQIAKSSRLAFSALYIQTSEGFTDVQTRTHIMENPHMQYFCGFGEYSIEPPFDASLMVHFRKRISKEMINHINEMYFGPEALNSQDAPEPDVQEAHKPVKSVAQQADNTSDAAVPAKEDVQNTSEPKDEWLNRGTLILDATCCPQDIHYPTDVGLLNQSREISENVIDALYKTVTDQYSYKPRTYREVARKDFLAFTKSRNHTASISRKAIRKQLNYLERDQRTVENLLENGAQMSALDTELYRKWLVTQEVLRQQQEMYNNKTHHVKGRIVSISQPWIRPIVRGKEGTPVEFGAKVALGLVGGYSFITDLSWENTPEASLLPQAADQYLALFGFYPKVILGDRAYPTRKNRDWCKQRGIRLSGPKLGRKKIECETEDAKQLYQDSCARIPIEGAFGVVKRKLGLDRIMTKKMNTSLTSISMGFFTANMERKLRVLFMPFSNSYIVYDLDLSSLVLCYADEVIQ